MVKTLKISVILEAEEIAMFMKHKRHFEDMMIFPISNAETVRILIRSRDL